MADDPKDIDLNSDMTDESAEELQHDLAEGDAQHESDESQ